uniref:Uncharacterized protein n=1 Tax=Anguilla anguilla TaxID=7936 RepID=A0A0E9R2J3_ANGAN
MSFSTTVLLCHEKLRWSICV